MPRIDERMPVIERLAERGVGSDRRRGRAAVTNPSGRYESIARVDEDDGWGSSEELPEFKTHVTVETPRSIITHNESPDIPFDQSINPYRGCEHGCIYCFARPTHAFMGLSPGLDFESRLFAKENAAALLEKELSAKNYKPKLIAIGTNTDPYQPIERQRKIMRGILEVLSRFNHPVGIVTKSALVTRDIDLLAPMAEKGLAKVYLSVTTLDGTLARRMEPRASTPMKRLDAVKQLNAAGIPTGVMVAPIIPSLNDHEIEKILEAAKVAKAQEANYIFLRLPLELKDLFREWLQDNYPGRLNHVLGLVKDAHGGVDYRPRFGERMHGEGVYATLIAQRFKVACERLGLNQERQRVRTDLFQVPPKAGDQMSLF